MRVQDARLQQSIEGYQLTVLAAASEIDDAAISVVKTKEQQVLLAEALKAADRSLVLSTKTLSRGLLRFSAGVVGAAGEGSTLLCLCRKPGCTHQWRYCLL